MPGDPPVPRGFGSALASADFNRDGDADLAIGSPAQPAGGQDLTGTVTVLYGTAQELAALAPHSRHLIARHGGHNIQEDQPELVLEAIRDVVQAVRRPASWSTR